MGVSHPDTAPCLNNLAALYKRQGRYAKAEPLYRQALAIREEQLGTTHLDTVTSLNNLATLYAKQGRYVEAEPFMLRAVTICLASLNIEHPQSQRILENYLTLSTYIPTEMSKHSFACLSDKSTMTPRGRTFALT
ncbi:hypothetical protein KSF_112920 [Reticulibacter mediterranei]|uniref:Kinesin light chain n=1 Tax=Reticulibacter mediterranei TaxID=2778369 RepID=A0A8J3N7I4_9CHLR|nr:hypothetical protein KSF_112920 [Reticulibacter mediterranei]